MLLHGRPGLMPARPEKGAAVERPVQRGREDRHRDRRIARDRGDDRAGLVRAGCRVYITARKKGACDAVAAELSALGECVSVPLDLAAPGSTDELAAFVSEREDPLDILVNNASASRGAPLAE
jgi:short chain dehydrogenase